jgi:hypothetical protein
MEAETTRTPRLVNGPGFDALHPAVVVGNDDLAGADADAEALEDLVGEFLNLGKGGGRPRARKRGARKRGSSHGDNSNQNWLKRNGRTPMAQQGDMAEIRVQS